MRKFIDTFSLLGLFLLTLCFVSLAAFLMISEAAWLLLLPTVFLASLSLGVGILLRGSHGGLLAYLKGQFPPRLRVVPRHVHRTWAEIAVFTAAEATIDLSRPAAQVSERFLSVTVDLSQVVGGKWWDPAAGHIEMSSGSLKSPIFDFHRPQLDRLTSALSPLYLRIGGSESDKIFYNLDNNPAVPPGYQSVLTRSQWDAIQAFCQRNDCRLIFTLNAGPAARNADGSWNPANAEALMQYAASREHQVEVWELGNELNVLFFVHGPMHQVSPAQYLRDMRILKELRDRYFPPSLLGGQGSAYWPVLGEPLGSFFGFTPDTLQQATGLQDIFTWHYYPQQSQRCPLGSRRAHPARLLDPAHLDEAGHWAREINRLRERYAPDLPVWLGETGNAQCGGAPGLSDRYLAGLWWLDQLGLMAQMNQQVVVRQSLTGMDYGLLDEADLTPRPDYWNSLLWRRLMGRTVFTVHVHGSDKLRLYAHSTSKDRGVTLLAINLDHQTPVQLSLPQLAGRAGKKYLLTTPDVLGSEVWLNGRRLTLGEEGAIPDTCGDDVQAGERMIIPPLAYVFFTFEYGS